MYHYITHESGCDYLSMPKHFISVGKRGPISDIMICNHLFENLNFWLKQISQWVNSVPPYVRKLHFMYEVVCTSSKCHWCIYRTSSKCHWGIYRTSRKHHGTLQVIHKANRSSSTLNMFVSCYDIFYLNTHDLLKGPISCPAVFISNYCWQLP